MTDILIGYVDYFKFSNPVVEEQLAPHPKQGSVYRIIKSQSDTKKTNPVYQIYIGKESNKAGMDTMFLGHSLEGEYFDKWEFSIIPVNKSNVYDFDIKSEELESLSKWLDTDNEDLKKLISKNPRPVDMNALNGDIEFEAPELPAEVAIPLERALTKIRNEEELYDQTIDKLSRAINSIVANDRVFTGVLADLLSYLSSTYEDKYEDSSRPSMSRDFLLTSNSPEVALFNSLKYIQRYCTTGFEKSGNPKDILKAIHYCLFELQRVKIQANNEEA